MKLKNRYIIVAVAIILLALGIVLLCTIQNNCVATTKPNVTILKNNQNKNIKKTLSQIEYEPSDGYYTGVVIVGNKSIQIKYRRLKKPIKITPNFTCEPSLTTSPLQSVLTYIYWGINAKQHDFIQCFEDPKEFTKFTSEYFNGSTREMYDSFKKIYGHSEILGEIVYQNTILIIFRFINSKNIPCSFRIEVVRHGNNYLIHTGGIADDVIKQLSADNYSLVTGMKSE